MQKKTFTYIKSNGEESDRKVLVLNPAKDYDMCLDISDVDMPQALDIVQVELKALHAQYQSEVKKLLAEFGLEDKIRNFKISRMSNITIENKE